MACARSSSRRVFVGFALASWFLGCSSADLTVANPTDGDAAPSDTSLGDTMVGADSGHADAADAIALDAAMIDLGVGEGGIVDAPTSDVGDDTCAPNPCGGCGGLTGAVGDPCKTCGALACVGDKLACLGDAPNNACGGCGGPTGTIGAPCTAAEECSAVLTCEGGGRKKQLSCVGTAGVANACGGCEVLAYAPGTPCNSCGDNWACAGQDNVTCPWSTTCPCGSLVGVTTPAPVGSNCNCGIEGCVTDSYGRQSLSCSHAACGVGKACCVTPTGPVCQSTGTTCTPP